ncbi:MAG: NAD-dependent epimerase/dehydratase family protein [Hafnia sp.]
MGSVMKVSITGGSGFIGKFLCEALVLDGHAVTLLSRKQTVEGHATVVLGDLLDNTESLDTFVADCDVIYHCAGEINNTALMHGLHVKGTAHLLAAVQRRIRRTGRPVHWVQLSSTGAYGAQADKEAIDESCQPAPVGDYEVTKTISDELVLSFAACEPLFTCTLLRPSIVIGPTMPNQSFFQLAGMVKKRLFFYIGNRHENVSTYIHVRDVVEAMLLCGTDARAIGETFILSNDCAQASVIEAFAHHVGVAVPRLQLPEKLIRFIIRMTPSFVRLPLTAPRVDALVKKGGYDSGHICRTLDFSFKSTVPESVPDVLNSKFPAVSKASGRLT